MDTWTVAFSPDSKYIATGSHAGKISLIGVESGKKESALDTRGKFTMSIAYVCYYDFFSKLCHYVCYYDFFSKLCHYLFNVQSHMYPSYMLAS